MIIGFFKNNPAISIIMVPLAAVILWSFSFVQPFPFRFEHPMPLFELITYWMRAFPLALKIMAIAFILGEAALLNYMVNSHEVLAKSSYLPAFIYIVLMSCSPSFLAFHPLVPANLFLLLALNSLFAMYRKERAFGNAFDSGFLIAIATLFYFPAIIFFLVIWIGFILLRPFIWREWIIALIGFIVPLLFTTVYYFWFDRLEFLWYDKIVVPIANRTYNFKFSFPYYLMFYTSVGFLILTLAKLSAVIATKSIKARAVLVILLWVLIFGVITFIVAPEISGKYFAFAIIPLSVFGANYFLTVKRNWWGELVFLILIIVVFYNHFAWLGGKS